jgi:hypothetical protein
MAFSFDGCLAKLDAAMLGWSAPSTPGPGRFGSVSATFARRSRAWHLARATSRALAEEIDRRVKIAELDAYLAALDAELGPVPQQELDAARQWADAVLPGRTAQSRGSR